MITVTLNMNDDYDYDEYADDENYADENEDGFDDDDEEEEGCRAQMLTKLVAIARQDARIQQVSDISLSRMRMINYSPQSSLS